MVTAHNLDVIAAVLLSLAFFVPLAVAVDRYFIRRQRQHEAMLRADSRFSQSSHCRVREPEREAS